jgi:hypothetical protein
MIVYWSYKFAMHAIHVQLPDVRQIKETEHTQAIAKNVDKLKT